MTACFNKGTLVSIMPLLWAVWKCRYAAVDTQPKLQHRKWKNLSIFFYLFFLTNQNLIIIACGYEIKVAEPKLNLNLGAGPSLTTISSPSYLLVCRLITTAVGDTVIWHFFCVCTGCLSWYNPIWDWVESAFYILGRNHYHNATH